MLSAIIGSGQVKSELKLPWANEEGTICTAICIGGQR